MPWCYTTSSSLPQSICYSSAVSFINQYPTVDTNFYHYQHHHYQRHNARSLILDGQRSSHTCYCHRTYRSNERDQLVSNNNNNSSDDSTYARRLDFLSQNNPHAFTDSEPFLNQHHLTNVPLSDCETFNSVDGLVQQQQHPDCILFQPTIPKRRRTFSGSTTGLSNRRSSCSSSFCPPGFTNMLNNISAVSLPMSDIDPRHHHHHHHHHHPTQSLSGVVDLSYRHRSDQRPWVVPKRPYWSGAASLPQATAATHGTAAVHYPPTTSSFPKSFRSKLLKRSLISQAAVADNVTIATSSGRICGSNDGVLKTNLSVIGPASSPSPSSSHSYMCTSNNNSNACSVVGTSNVVDTCASRSNSNGHRLVHCFNGQPHGCANNDSNVWQTDGSSELITTITNRQSDDILPAVSLHLSHLCLNDLAIAEAIPNASGNGGTSNVLLLASESNLPSSTTFNHLFNANVPCESPSSNFVEQLYSCPNSDIAPSNVLTVDPSRSMYSMGVDSIPLPLPQQQQSSTIQFYPPNGEQLLDYRLHPAQSARVSDGASASTNLLNTPHPNSINAFPPPPAPPSYLTNQSPTNETLSVAMAAVAAAAAANQLALHSSASAYSHLNNIYSQQQHHHHHQQQQQASETTGRGAPVIMFHQPDRLSSLAPFLNPTSYVAQSTCRPQLLASYLPSWFASNVVHHPSLPVWAVQSSPSNIGFVNQTALLTTHDVHTLFQFLRLINQTRDPYSLPYYPSAMTATARGGSNQSVVVSASTGVPSGSRVASAVTPPLMPHHPSPVPSLFSQPAVSITVQSDQSAAVALAAFAMAAACALQHQTHHRYSSLNAISSILQASSSSLSSATSPSLLSSSLTPRRVGGGAVPCPTPSIPVPILYYPQNVATLRQWQHQQSLGQQCHHHHHHHHQQQQQQQYQQPFANIYSQLQPPIVSPPAYLTGLFPYLLTTIPPPPVIAPASSNDPPPPPPPPPPPYSINPTSLAHEAAFLIQPQLVPNASPPTVAAASVAVAAAAAAVSVDTLFHLAVHLEQNVNTQTNPLFNLMMANHHRHHHHQQQQPNDANYYPYSYYAHHQHSYRQQQQQQQGLSKHELESLTVSIYRRPSPTKLKDDAKQSRDDRCMICLDDYEDGEELRQMRCLHEFHAKCVDRWLKTKRTCPLCRADAFDGTQHKDDYF